MKRLLLNFLFCSTFLPSLIAQCNLTMSISDTTIGCGSSLMIDALGNSPGPMSANTFNSGTIGAGWNSTQTLLFTNPCGPSLDGSPSAWFGDSPLPRTLSTSSFDISCGAQICFDLDYGNEDTCGMCTDCEDPDLLDEGVYFQYSIDGGLTWVDIFYFQPDSVNNAGYYQWANYCFDLPPASWTPSTTFRWNQTNISSNLHDHWGIDNVAIIPNNCAYYYDWSNVSGFPDPSSQIVTPSDTITYYVEFTDGVTSCFDSVTVNVIPLDIEIVADPSTIDCGSCSELSVQALVGSVGTLQDDFESGINQLIWEDIQNGSIGTICVPSASGNSLFFDQIGSFRYAQTVGIDVNASSTIDFCLYMGNAGSTGTSCENCEPGENIRLEYSVDNGATFLPIATYDQSLWDLDNSQQCFSEAVPIGAQTASTIFRWRQLSFSGFPGSDTWNLDEVEITSFPATMSYNWSTGVLDDALSPTPSACPLSDTLYTVSVLNSATGCGDTDTMTLFVDDCLCEFLGFDANLVFLPTGQIDVAGTFQFANSPSTGTLELEITNGTGTYSQTYNAPFTDSLVYNFSISGLTNDSSDVTVNIYFSDSLSCSETVIIQIPTNCLFTYFTGNATLQPNGLIDVDGYVQFSDSPSTGTLEVVAGNSIGAFVQSFNAPFTNNLIYNYSIQGIPNDSSIITLAVFFSDSLICADSLILAPVVGIELLEGQDGICVVAPNPVSNEAQLIFNNETQEELTIYIKNQLGQIVFETTSSNQSIPIQGAQFRQGIYFYAIKSKDESERCSGKFAVIRE